MTRLEDRQTLIQEIDAARASGARQAEARGLAGINPRTIQRWRKNNGQGDRRPDAIRPAPAHALTDEERARIVPVLADEGTYIASESSFHRVLRAHGQMNRRGRAKPPRRSRPPTPHIATGPGEVWCWYATFPPATVRGSMVLPVLILDLYSRKIVGFEVHATDGADHAAHLARRTALTEDIHAMAARPVLHGDNGATLKATTVIAMLHWLGIEPSCSRLRVSDDNPYVEALFRTAKYRPEFPAKGFPDLDAARDWVSRFVHWYNNEHRHSGIKYVTPTQRHAGQDRSLLTARHELYQQARRSNPRRWSRQTRDRAPAAAVTLNPERDAVVQAASKPNQLSGSVGTPAFPSRPDNLSPRVRSRGEERSGAARSHAQRHLRREHGEDGEHPTFPGASTMAHSARLGGPGHRQRTAKKRGDG